MKNDDPKLLNITTKDDEIEDLKNKMEKRDQETNFKTFNIDKDWYSNKEKSLKNRKELLIISETSIGSGTAITSSTLSFLHPSVGFIATSSTALITSTAILITNDYISKLKKRYTKVRGCIKVVTLLFEKVLKESIIDQRCDEKEAQD